jgi:hypothetical protein
MTAPITEIVTDRRLDWTSDDGSTRHFYYFVVCRDNDANVLAVVNDCLTRLGDLSGMKVYVRHMLSIERGLKDFSSDAVTAIIHYRLAIDLHSRPPPMVGLGLAPTITD